MIKPKWLKKANSKLGWKYKIKTDKGIIIEPYNFNSYFGQDLIEVEKAIKWIDWKIDKQ